MMASVVVVQHKKFYQNLFIVILMLSVVKSVWPTPRVAASNTTVDDDLYAIGERRDEVDANCDEIVR